MAQCAADKAFQQEFLKAHNEFRIKHGAPPLTLNTSMNTSAQAWAQYLLSQMTLQHSDTEDGENVFYFSSSSGTALTGKEAVESWYSEIKDYDFNVSEFKSGTGHFTQVVWQESRELGVGLATDGNTTFVVGQYRPAGNMMGEFKQNVLPPLGDTKLTDKLRKLGIDADKPKAFIGSVLEDRGQSDAEFTEEFVRLCNRHRADHGAQPLTLNTRLRNGAAAWAQSLLGDKELKQSPPPYSEIVYGVRGSEDFTLTGNDVAEKWYSKGENYDFSCPGQQSEAGYFPQLVWCDCKEVGIAQAKDNKGKIIIVARFSPALATSDKQMYAQNVRPKGSKVAATPVASPSISDMFALQFIQTCNRQRANHGAPPLSQSTSLSEGASAWAQHLVQQTRMTYSPAPYNELIWAVIGPPGTTATGKQVVEKWYKEAEDYDFSKSESQRGTGKFTQLVWCSTKEVGVSRAVGADGKVIVVARFQPAGNIVDEFRQNVLPKGRVRRPVEDAQLSPVPGKDLETFVQSLVETMNEYRACHAAGPLTLNPSMSKEAQEWAARLARAGQLETSDNVYGQNYWQRSGSNKTLPLGSEVADSWYKENRKYNFSTPGFQRSTGNFTQMVWKGSRDVGVGLATNGQGGFFVVAFFDPSGNISNTRYFRENVSSRDGC